MHRKYLMAAALAAVSVPGGVVAQSPTEASENANKETVRRAFDAWAAGGTRFFDILSEDVVWTIVGSGPSARTYRGKAEFLAKAVTPFGSRMSAPLTPKVRAIYADGDEVVTLWDGVARTRDGQTYRNSYAWFFTMRDGKAVAARAYLDLPAYDAVLRRVRPAPAR